MAEWSNWKIAGSVLLGGLLIGGAGISGVLAYWRLESPEPLRAVREPQFINIRRPGTYAVDIPAHEYEYLGPFVFSTRTLDLEGDTVWTTQWTSYNPRVQYKFVPPASLSPGLFSVVLTIDYQINPVSRAEGEVKFLDLVVNEEEK